jgi:glycosyltransferase involved in cell wall biosynthesis
MNLQGVKILHLSTVDFAVKHFVSPLIRHQAECGADVGAICSPREYFQTLQDEGIRMIACPMSRSASPIKQTRALMALIKILRKERPDVLHCHTPIAGFLGRVAGAISGVPVRIYTVHGYHFHEYSKAHHAFFYKTIERVGSRFGHNLLFVSEEDLKTARKMRLRPEDELHWVGNGINIEACQSGPEKTAALREELGIASDSVVIGFVGRMVAEKGLAELATAFRNLLVSAKNITLLCVGGKLSSDDTTVVEALQDLLNDSELSKNVVCTGLVADARQYLEVMDIFVLPSYREGLPVALMEAMAARRACLATRIRGCRELIVSEANGLLVPIRDADALQDALLVMLESEAKREKYGEAAFETIKRRYTEEDWIDRNDEAYREALAKRLPEKLAT